MKYMFLLVALSSLSMAEWIDFGVTDLGHASLEVVECSPSGFTVDLTVPGFFSETVTEQGMTFNVLSVPSLTPYAETEGAPMLPKASFLAAVPEFPDVSVTVEPIGDPVVIDNFNPSPMQPIPADNSYDPVPFTYLPDMYARGSYPVENAAFEEAGVLRGVNIGRFTVMPFSWDAGSQVLTVQPRLRVTVELGGSVQTDPRLRSRFFRNTYRTLVNAQVLEAAAPSVHRSSGEVIRAHNIREARDITAADLLIIAGDDFVDTMMDTFIESKMQQGYLTAIVAAGSWTQTEIYDYIKDAYDNWEIPPSFILFVGDQGDLTSYNAPTGCYSDNRYVCVDGTDYLPDIFHSRFVTPTSHYPIVEDKILKWEFNPLMDADFWGHALTAGMLQANGGTVATRWFCFTLESVRDTYMNIYGKEVQREYVKDTSQPPPYYYRNDLPSAGQQIPMDIVWDGNAAGITDAINGGVFLVQHRDHGSVSGWADPSFHTSNLGSLTNGDMTPMVMSTNCLTGKFDEDCFAENFFRMEGGAVGVLAATEVSYSYFNDHLTYGHHKSFVDEFTSPPALYTDPTGNYLAGQALTGAKMEMYVAAPFNPYGSWEYYAEITIDLFHWFGDPTMDMRTEVPHELTVDAPYSLPVGSTEATFYVDHARAPVPNALVCISHDSLWVSGVTDSTGFVTLEFDPIGGLSDIIWMVTSHNALPAQGVINGMGIEDGPDALVTSVGTPWPNPVSGLLSIPVTLSGTGNFRMSVYDTAGRMVATVHSGELAAGQHTITWDTSEVPQGVYMLHSADPAGTVHTSRIVICR